MDGGLAWVAMAECAMPSVLLALTVHAFAAEIAYDHDCFVREGGGLASVRVAGDHPAVTASLDCHLVAEGGLVVPVGAEVQRLDLVWTSFAPPGTRGTVAVVEVRYADGTGESLEAALGSEVWRTDAPRNGPHAWSEPIGRGPDGSARSLAVLALPTRSVGEVVDVVVRRSGAWGLAVVDLRVDAPPDPTLATPLVTDVTGWYPFPTAAELRLPGAPPPEPVVGPVTACGEDLCAGGQPVRFWGVRVEGAAAAPPPEEAERVARSLARAGFNLARLSDLGSSGVIVGSSVDAAALDRMDRLVASLLREGLYVVLTVPDPDRPGDADRDHLEARFRGDLLQAREDLATALWGRVNPHTGRRYADEPGVAWIDFDDGPTLVHAWLDGALEALPEEAATALDASWNDWLRARHGSDEGLANAWVGDPHGGLQPGESLEGARVRRSPASRVHAPDWPVARVRDLHSFYAGLEAAWSRRALEHVRRQLGFRGIVVGGEATGEAIADSHLLPFDATEVSVRWDVPRGRVLQGASAVDLGPITPFGVLGAALADRPTVLSEVVHGFPNPHLGEAPLLWATLGRLQGVDAVIWGGWSEASVGGTPPLGPDGSLRANPALWSQLPLAARLYRLGALDAAAGVAERQWSAEALLEDLASTVSGVAGLRDPAGLVAHRQRTRFSDGPSRSVPGVPPKDVAWSPGTLAVATEGLAAVTGLDGSRALGKAHVSVDRRAQVWVVAVDGVEVGRSRELVVSATARVENTGQVWSSGGGGVLAFGGPPALLEPVEGMVRLPMPCRPVAQALSADGTPLRSLEVRNESRHRWIVPLPGDSPWVTIGCTPEPGR